MSCPTPSKTSSAGPALILPSSADLLCNPGPALRNRNTGNVVQVGEIISNTLRLRAIGHNPDYITTRGLVRKCCPQLPDTSVLATPHEGGRLDLLVDVNPYRRQMGDRVQEVLFDHLVEAARVACLGGSHKGSRHRMLEHVK